MTIVTAEMDLNTRQRFGVNACREVKRVGAARRPLLPADPLRNDGGSAGRILCLTDSRGQRLVGAEWQECGCAPTTSLTAAAREVSRITRFEQLAYAALSVGGVVSIGSGFVHAEKLLAGWPAFAKLVEGFLS